MSATRHTAPPRRGVPVYGPAMDDDAGRSHSGGDDGGLTGRQMLGLGASLLWAAFWVIGGIGTGLDASSGTSLGAGLAVAGGLGVAPMLPVWWTLGRRGWLRRGSRRRRRLEREARARIERLPERMRDDWARLEAARVLVDGFAEQGWVEPASLLEVEDQLARLERLLAADRQTDALGGAPSDHLDDRVRELADLLVALADEAVEHQAALVSDIPVPATLAEARERLLHAREAYRELSEPTWTPPPRPVAAPAPPPVTGPATATDPGEGTGQARQYPSA